MAVTLYWVVQPDATATPTGAQIVAGQDGTGAAALASGSEAYTSAGDYSEASAITGLSAGTSYEQAWVAYDGSTYSNVATVTITTPNSWTISPSGSIVFSGTAALSLTSATIYTITPTGSIVFSGSAAQIKEDVFEVGGTLTFSGSAEQIKDKVYLPTGTVTFSGTAPLSLTNGATEWTITPSGGVTFSGAPLQIHEKVFLPSGAITFSGTNPLIKEDTYEPSGSITFSGTAPLTLVPAGSVTVNTYRPLTGVGH